MTRLDGGRRVHHLEFGDARGVPVVWLHGVPGGASEATVAAGPAARHGVRLISPSRPGIGRSDPAPGASLLDWPADLEALLDAHGIERAVVLGVSGGGPRALACALRIPDRLRAVGLVAPAGPPSGAEPAAVMRAAGLAMRIPVVSTAAAWAAIRVSSRFSGVPGPARAGALASFRESATPAATRETVAIEHGEWGFAPGDVRMRGIEVWQGDRDRSIDPERTRRLTAELPAAQLTMVPGADHLGVIAGRADEIMAWAADVSRGA